MSAHKSLLMLLGAATLAACSSDSDEAGVAAESTPAPAPATVAVPGPAPAAPPAAMSNEIPDVIVAERGGFIPEGIEYDNANGRFLTGSLAEGSIFEIGLDGSVTAVITDPELVSTVGIEVDEARDRVLAANSNRAAFGGGPSQAVFAAFSLTTGERLAMVDLDDLVDAGEGAAFFANDVAVADDGTAFVTDTMQNVVYRVGLDYAASIHYAFEGVEGLSLNGIEWHPDGYLIVIDSTNGRLYKLGTSNGSTPAMVAVPEAVAGGDGIVWNSSGALAVVQNSATDGRVTLLQSDDGWLTASIAGVSTHAGQATTGAAVGDEIFSVQPHFNDAEPPSIHRATF